MDYLLLIVGFVFLIKGADLFVDGASTIAKALKVPTILIGLTIVAFGTSAPELAVSIKSAFSNSADLAVGNIAGSSIFNLLLVIGITSLIKPIKIQKSVVYKEFPFLLLATAVVFVLCADIKFEGAAFNSLSRGNGIVLLSLFAIFMYYLVDTALKSRKIEAEAAATVEDSMLSDENKKESSQAIMKDVLLGGLGLVGVVLGGDLVVESSKNIALALGMSEALVGLTIVAVGTSLPELVTSTIAALKGESDMAIGNVIGSNVFNLLLILGITSTIKPIAINAKMVTDMIYLLIISLITYVFAVSGKKTNKKEGILLILLYVVYAVYIVIRN